MHLKPSHTRLTEMTFLLCMLTVVAAEGQQYVFHKYGLREGLVQSQSTTLTQDKFGRLWIGTLGGLSCFNGQEFATYTKKQGTGSNSIYGSAADQNGSLWFGTLSGLVVYDGKIFRSLSFQGDTNKQSVTRLACDGFNNVWALRGGRLYTTGGSRCELTEDSFFREKKPTSLATDVHGRLWVGTGMGSLYALSGGSWTRYLEQPATGPIRRLLITKKGEIYFIAEGGLFKQQGKKITNIGATLEPGPGSSFFSLLEDRTGAIWVGAEKGVYRLDGDLLKFDATNGFVSVRVSALLQDAQGNIWLGTNGEGLFRFGGRSLNFYHAKDGLTDPIVMSIAKRDTASFWLGTSSGIYLLEKGKCKQQPATRRLRPTAIAALSNKGLLIGTQQEGLYMFRGGVLKKIAARDSGLSEITALKHTPQGTWIGTRTGLFFTADHRYFKRIEGATGWITCILVQDANTVLAGSIGSILAYQPLTGKIGYIRDELTRSTIVMALASAGGKVLIGTSDEGLLIYDPQHGTLRALTTTEGLSSDYVYSLEVNERGTWIGTGNGIDYLRNPGDTASAVLQVGGNEPFLKLECNQNAVVTDAAGNLWFGTTAGLIRFSPRILDKGSATPAVMLTGVKLFSKPLRSGVFNDTVSSWFAIPHGLQLPHNSNHLSFEFNGFSLQNGNALRYQYMLEGVDKDYGPPSPMNYVIYPNLEPGKYVFKVKSSNGDKRDGAEYTYQFEILQQFYKTPWFAALLFAAFIGIGIRIQWGLHRRKEQKNKLIDRLRSEELVKLRQQTSEDFHDELGNKLTRIAVLTDILMSKNGDLSQENRKIIVQLKESAQSLYTTTRDVIWALDPRNDSLYDILIHMMDTASEAFMDTDINYCFTGIKDSFKEDILTMEYSRNLIMIFKECINNILKHSRAQNVFVTVDKTEAGITLTIRDDGTGFDEGTTSRRGYGLNNISKRAKRIHAEVSIDSALQRGTTIRIFSPAAHHKPQQRHDTV